MIQTEHTYSEINKVSGCYFIKSLIDDRYYVGSSITLYDRFKTHQRLLRRNEHFNILLQNFVNKHGLDALEFEVFYLNERESKIRDMEQYWLDAYSPEFNIGTEVGRERAGCKLSDEQIEDMRQRMLGVKRGPMSDETKNRISENTGLRGRFGKDHPKAKGVFQLHADWSLVKKWGSMSDASRELSIPNSTIQNAASRGGSFTKYGFRFVYA